jgi:hypothetical protein
VEKTSFTKQQQNTLTKCFSIHEKSSFLTLFLKFLAAVFCSEVFLFRKWFGTAFREFFSIFVPQNGILSCLLWNGYFHCTKKGEFGYWHPSWGRKNR